MRTFKIHSPDNLQIFTVVLYFSAYSTISFIISVQAVTALVFLCTCFKAISDTDGSW